VPIYPFEGTFMATHPACLNHSADAETQEAARLFRDYLLGQAAQEAAAAGGLRPVSQQAGPMAAPEKIPGLDLTQPEIIFDPPSVQSIYAVQDVWQAARREVSLVMLLDTSGSMAGDKMESMRRAAIQFVEQMGDSDFITIIAFSTRPVILIQNQQVKVARAEAISKIAGMSATGDTALYDAIGIGASLIAGSTSSQISNAMVVLSDGLDTSSYQYSFDQRLIEAAAANDTTVFTIAYGSDADQALLTQLASQANGNFYLGSEANIAAIYQEMSAAFGGSVGIGR
jgi:Ca-activated chloride channel family protein